MLIGDVGLLCVILPLFDQKKKKKCLVVKNAT